MITRIPGNKKEIKHKRKEDTRSALLRQLAVLNPSTPEPACLGFRAEQAQSKAEAAPEEGQSEA